MALQESPVKSVASTFDEAMSRLAAGLEKAFNALEQMRNVQAERSKTAGVINQGVAVQALNAFEDCKSNMPLVEAAISATSAATAKAPVVETHKPS